MKKIDRFEQLSDELIEEVLIRIPSPKTLIRCKSVCKHWKRLISETSFKTRFRSLSPVLFSGFICNNGYRLNFVDLSPIESSEKIIDDGNLPFLNPPAHLLFASISGLLLIKKDLRSLCICNPVTKESVAFVDEEAFGGNLYLFTSNAVCFGLAFNNFISVVTFFFHTNRWKYSDISHNLGSFKVSHNYVLSDGSVYLWDEKNRILCLFNLEEESVHAVELPDSFSDDKFAVDLHDSFSYDKLQFLGVSAGSIYYVVRNGTYLRQWLLVDKFNWLLKHSVEHVETFTSVYRPIAFHPMQPELLLVRSYRDEYFFYHMDTGRMECYTKLPRDCRSVTPYSFHASLVL